MQRHLNDVRDVLMFAQGLIYFVFLGLATVAIAIAAHLR
jgi:hypothetical protein